jgi:glycosyltransferase involved in cell wall biosynthesis
MLPNETSLAMYGRGGEEERRRLGQLAGDLKVADRVTFGSLDREELGVAYRSADAVVFPSEWPEPFGLVPLEAMECGTPVVATGVGGSADFLEDGGNCLLFQPGDPADLARALLRLAEDAQLRERVVDVGRGTALTYDVVHMADAYEKAFLAAVDGTR